MYMGQHLNMGSIPSYNPNNYAENFRPQKSDFVNQKLAQASFAAQ